MALTVSVELSDAEVAALKHDLPGEDGIKAWVEAAVRGKAHACEKRMANEGLAAVRRGEIGLGGLQDLSPRSLAAALAKHPGYKDRTAREETAIRKG